jgi:DNA-binding LacI/PurR family transcriptional regulator
MSTEEPAPTIFDVADLASVSVSTVSRVINGRADVSAATRSRVEAAIGRLSFAPQVTAQRLAGRRSHTVAMLFPSAYAQHSNHDLDFVLGAAEATSGRDYLFNVASDPLDEPRMRALFRSRLVEGAILMQITAQDWRVELAAREQLPCVLIGRTDTEHPLSWVDFDFEGAAAAMVDHLVMTGHRSIGFVGRSHAMLDAGLGPATRLRRGHEQAVLRHGLELHHVASDLDPLAAGQAALHLVDSVDDLSAVVATHGPSALGSAACPALPRPARAGGRLGAHRRHEPGGRALDAVPVGHRLPLRAARLPGRQRAGRQLDDRARGVAPRTEHILMPARLSVRETSAPLARS